jgi:hypothetical protein
MSEKKVVYQSNVISLPTLKMVLGEDPSPNPKRDGHKRSGLDIDQPGIEMEMVVTKLITHLKKKQN